MRKIIIFIVIAVFVFAAYSLLNSNNSQVIVDQNLDKEVLGKEVVETNKLDIYLNESQYTLIWFKANNLENLELIPNFEEKTSSSKIAEKYSCKFLTNAGFYSEDSKPIGYFLSGNEILSNYQTNSLLNGILSINFFDVPRITRTVPKDGLKNAIQTGPILIENGMKLNLSMVRDQNARRMVAGVTGLNELIFIAVYDSKSAYSGPELIEMKKILEIFEEKTGVILADAINLDGGTASAFYIGGENSKNQKSFELSELSPVGSFFCLN